MATTIITFKALGDHRIIRKNIPIEHNFEVIPPTVFNGVELPATSIESQVIDYLDGIDKTELMIKYGFDVIIDYWPKKTKRKRNEIDDFVMFCKPYIERYPTLERPFRAVISESKDVLFGRNKSNETKLKEVFNMIDIAYKTANGVINIVNNILTENDADKTREQSQIPEELARDQGCNPGESR